MQEGQPQSELAPGVSADPEALRMQFARGGGPGGQNVNKVNTKAELWVTLSGLRGMSATALARLAALAGSQLTAAGEIHITSTRHRTQERNRQDVLEKLREMIVEAQVEPKKRRKTRPTKASRQRRIAAKLHRGRIIAERKSTDD
ncbi:MAG: alternative ribosome rescue aminoacyl-tRNA hydrolase ArfB [Tepidisphaeraceae bacterium]